ncbi:hypothetical protein [uncultured Brachyspira sp.]|uniref:hypothetical protein n=1 Tax=uncultured Brachyspira sp. TaxID=221953 RepID=UPI00262E74E9|nr:hypothetical protein [uncultured Brachyspira sp.]
MILGFFMNLICKKKLEKQREKLKLKIADIENYRAAAINRVKNFKENCDKNLNDLFNYLSDLKLNIENNFYLIVKDDLKDVSNIIEKSYDVVFDMIDFDLQIKVLVSKIGNIRREINILRKSKIEAEKILKVFNSYYKKNDRLKWFNNCNDKNIKCVEELKGIITEDNAENINMLIELCDRDAINYNDILVIKKYIKSVPEKIDFLFKNIENINSNIEKIKNKASDCYKKYVELQNKYYDIYNRELSYNDVLPEYDRLVSNRDKLIDIKRLSFDKAQKFSDSLKERCKRRENIYNFDSLKEQETILWDKYKSDKSIFDDANKKCSYYYDTAKFLIKERKKCIKELYSKSIITLKKINEMGITYYKDKNSLIEKE